MKAKKIPSQANTSQKRTLEFVTTSYKIIFEATIEVGKKRKNFKNTSHWRFAKDTSGHAFLTA